MEMKIMYSERCVEVWLVCAVCDSVSKILDGHRIIAVPKETHLVIECIHRTCIVGNVPTAGEMLGESCDIASVCIHKAEVAVCLKKRSCKLHVRVEGLHLRSVSVQTLHIFLAAGRENDSDSQQGDQGFIYLLHNLYELEFEVDIETEAAA